MPIIIENAISPMRGSLSRKDTLALQTVSYNPRQVHRIVGLLDEVASFAERVILLRDLQVVATRINDFQVGLLDLQSLAEFQAAHPVRHDNVSEEQFDFILVFRPETECI